MSGSKRTYGMFTPEGNAAVRRLVARLGKVGEGWPGGRVPDMFALGALEGLAIAHPEATDTVVRTRFLDALQQDWIRRTGRDA